MTFAEYVAERREYKQDAILERQRQIAVISNDLKNLEESSRIPFELNEKLKQAGFRCHINSLLNAVILETEQDKLPLLRRIAGRLQKMSMSTKDPSKNKVEVTLRCADHSHLYAYYDRVLSPTDKCRYVKEVKEEVNLVCVR